MKSKFTFSLLLIAMGVFAQEQNINYTSGGFGHFFQGPSYYMPNNLIDYLESPAVLNAPISSRFGTTSGGEGAALMNKFLVGGGGFAQTSARHVTDSTRMKMSLGGGYFKFGYAIKSCNNNLIYAYGGLGWGAMLLRFDNFSKDSGIRFDNNNPVRPGYVREYELNLSYYDLGLSFKRIASSDKKTFGGFMFGIDIGTFITQSTGDWNSNSDEVVSGPPELRMGLDPYVRITIGGGGFTTEDAAERN